MLSKEQILQAVSGGRESQCLDGRDFARLIDFFPVSEWKLFGTELREGEEAPTPKELTREAVLSCLESDLAFGFDKALDKRSGSAECMYEVVKMWMWVLEDDLQHFSDYAYAMYGLPLFKAVALKYGFPNPIGDDAGNESKYSSRG